MPVLRNVLMLKGINPILGPEILYTIRSMGHGDKLALVDSNFPSSSLNSEVIRLDGVNIKSAAEAILSLFPLDSFVDFPALRMEMDNNPKEINEVHKDFINAIKNYSGDNWNVGSISRMNFYEEAKKVYAIIQTSESRPFGCFIITKGVILPDGSVWVK